MSRYQLIVFDWDGTLMDSTAHIVQCMQAAITQLELAPLENNAIKHIIAEGMNAYKKLNPASWTAPASIGPITPPMP